MLKDYTAPSANGIMMLLLLPIGLLASVALLIWSIKADQPAIVLSAGLAALILSVCLGGFFRLEPNQAAALTLFGRYKGSVKRDGLRWTNPFYGERKVSLRVRNFESDRLKVNDLNGSPIEIACVVVWRVVDSAEALFAVDHFETFVQTQSESALRQMATTYPYEVYGEEGIGLRSHADEVSDHLAKEIQDRLDNAGVEVLEARITHLAYAHEVAQAMLQRQQAGAIIAARRQIVDGAVSMVEMALEDLEKKGMVKLDEERRAAMVSNLLVVLCADRNPQPIVNTGSLY